MMRNGIGLIAMALCLSGCVGTDVMSSVAPSPAGLAGQFGYPAIQQASLPALSPTNATAQTALASTAPPASPALPGQAAPRPVPAPLAIAAPVASVAKTPVYDEARDPAFAALIAGLGQSEPMPDLPLKSDGSMKLPPPPKLDIIDVDAARATLQVAE